MKKLPILTFLGIILFYTTTISAQKRHELSVSYGLLPTSDFMDIITDITSDIIISPSSSANRSETIHETGAINLSYHHFLNHTFGFGVGFSYAGAERNWYDQVDGASSSTKIGSDDMHYVSILLQIKANWIHAKYVSLYSLIGAGCIVGVINSEYEGKEESNVNCTFGWQVSPIGLEVGSSSLRAFGELGFGQMGCFQLGVRGRF